METVIGDCDNQNGLGIEMLSSAITDHHGGQQMKGGVGHRS